MKPVFLGLRVDKQGETGEGKYGVKDLPRDSPTYSLHPPPTRYT